MKRRVLLTTDTYRLVHTPDSCFPHTRVERRNGFDWMGVQRWSEVNFRGMECNDAIATKNRLLHEIGESLVRRTTLRRRRAAKGS